MSQSLALFKLKEKMLKLTSEFERLFLHCHEYKSNQGGFYNSFAGNRKQLRNVVNSESEVQTQNDNHFTICNTYSGLL